MVTILWYTLGPGNGHFISNFLFFLLSQILLKAYYYKKFGLVDLSTYGAGRLNLIFGCRGNAGLDGRIQILFSRHEYSSTQGWLSYNNKPLKCSIIFCKMFATSPVGSIWLEMSINWPTTSQGPKKKSIQITRWRIDHCPAHTARN